MCVCLIHINLTKWSAWSHNWCMCWSSMICIMSNVSTVYSIMCLFKIPFHIRVVVGCVCQSLPHFVVGKDDKPVFTICMCGLQCVVKGAFKWCGCTLIKSEHFINHHINNRQEKKSAYQTVIVIKHWFQCSACRLTVCAFSLCGPLKQPITTSTVWGSLTVNSEPGLEYDVFTCLLT